jgi:flagellar basal-body rod modification protein FlgD
MSADITDYLANQRGAVGMVDKNSSADALSSGQANLSSSYETFLSLLTAQLKNQDPTSPLDTNSFTQQLVQMTGVQQQLLSNQLLKSLVTQGENGDVKDALGLIGKTVTAMGEQSVLKDGKATWAYELGKTASKAVLTVTDSSGKVMWSGDAPDLTKGEHEFVWDGKGTNAGTDGQTYTLSLAATDANGVTVTSGIYMRGLVGSVRQTADGALVNIGGAEAPLTAVTAVKG